MVKERICLKLHQAKGLRQLEGQNESRMINDLHLISPTRLLTKPAKEIQFKSPENNS